MYYWQTWGWYNLVYWSWTPLYFKKWNCYCGSTVLPLKAKSKYLHLSSQSIIKGCGAFYCGLSCEKLTGLEIAVWHSRRRNLYQNSVVKLCNYGLYYLLMEVCRYKHSCMGHTGFIMGLSHIETNWNWNTWLKVGIYLGLAWLRTLLSRGGLQNWS